MTEAVLDGGAPAPAEPSAAPIDTAPVTVANPLGSQSPVAEKPEAAPADAAPKTAGDAVRKAMETIKAKEAAKDTEAAALPKDGAKPDGKPEAAKPEAKASDRGADGKFAPKPSDAAGPAATDGQQQPISPAAVQPAAKNAAPAADAPTRFDAAGKAEWANVPESVKGNVHRAFRELEAGIEEHRARYEPVKRYDEMAKQYGTDLPSALERYVSMDRDLSTDLIGGLDRIVRDKTGNQFGIREVLAHLGGQQPDQTQSQNDATIHTLRTELAALKQQIGGVTGHIQRQAETSVSQQVEQFAAGKPHFDALSGQIAEHIRAGMGLDAAYEQAFDDAQRMARSLGFAPAATPGQPLIPADPASQPLKPAGQKSIHGAPASGSDPATLTRKAPSTSIRDALKRAAARAG